MAGIMTALFVSGAALCMYSNIALRHHGLPYESMYVMKHLAAAKA